MNQIPTPTHFDDVAIDLTALDKLIAQMGGRTEQALGFAFDSLLTRDPQLAAKVRASDAAIDDLEKRIEAEAIAIMAKRHCSETDLRRIMAAVRIASDLERIGDFAKNIAKRAAAIASEHHPKSLMTGLRQMVELALSQLKQVLDAYAERDTQKALAAWNADHQIDVYYNSLFRELLTFMMQDSRNVNIATHLLFGAKNIERVGDHTTNIAENICVLTTGKPFEKERPKGDDTSYTLVGTNS